MSKHELNEKGLTLIEIIITVVLLSIVLTAFFTFFIQSTQYSKFNEEKLTSVQVAEDVVAKIRNMHNDEDLIDKFGYEIIGGKYMNSMTYSPFEVQIQIVQAPFNNFKRAIITVSTNSNLSPVEEKFTTEMYFSEEDAL